jgi:hypothetical protein
MTARRPGHAAHPRHGPAPKQSNLVDNLLRDQAVSLNCEVHCVGVNFPMVPVGEIFVSQVPVGGVVVGQIPVGKIQVRSVAIIHAMDPFLGVKDVPLRVVRRSMTVSCLFRKHEIERIL